MRNTERKEPGLSLFRRSGLSGGRAGREGGETEDREVGRARVGQPWTRGGSGQGRGRGRGRGEPKKELGRSNREASLEEEKRGLQLRKGLG